MAIRTEPAASLEAGAVNGDQGWRGTLGAIGATLRGRASRHTVNVGSGFVQLGVNFVCGLYLVRYLVHHLDTATYGGIATLTQVVSNLAAFLFFGNALFVRTIARGEVQGPETGSTESTSRAWGDGVVSSVLFAVVLVALLVNFDAVFRLAEPVGGSFELFFLLLGAAFLVSHGLAVFDVVPHALGQAWVSNGIQASSSVLRVGGVVALFVVAGARVEWVGAATLVATSFVTVASWAYWRSRARELMLSVEIHLRGWLERAASGTSVLLNKRMEVLRPALELWLVGWLSPVAAGQYGIVVAALAPVRLSSMAFASNSEPELLYPEGSREETFSRLVNLNAGVVTAGVCTLVTFSRPLVNLWLGPDHLGVVPWIQLFAVVAGVALLVEPVTYFLYVKRRDRPLVIANAASLGLVAAVIALPTGLSPLGRLAVASAAGLACRTLVFVPLILRELAESYPLRRWYLLLAGYLVTAVGSRAAADWLF